MLWSHYFIAYLAIISSVIYGFGFIIDLIGKKTITAFANFTYSATTLVMSILILVTKSVGFIGYYSSALALAFALMAYADYKDNNRGSAKLNTIASFIFAMVFITTHILAVLA